MDLEKIKITNLFMDIYMEDLLSVVNTKDHSLTPGKAHFNLTGEMSINSADNFKVNPKLQFSLTPGLTYNIDDLSIKTAMKGEFRKNKFHMEFQKTN